MNYYAKKRGLLTIVLALLLAFRVSSAWALSFDLDTANSAGSGTTGPYVSVTVVLDNATQIATFTFESLTNGGLIYLMGAHGAADVNINSTSFTVGTITGTNSIAGFTPGPYSTDSGNVNGFGSYNLVIDSFNGFTNSADKIVFTVHNTSANLWNTDADVLALNSNNSMAEAHVFPCDEDTCSPTSGVTGQTFFVAGNTGGPGGPGGDNGPGPFETPEPSSLVLVGTGLLGLSAVIRRRFSRK